MKTTLNKIEREYFLNHNRAEKEMVEIELNGYKERNIGADTS